MEFVIWSIIWLASSVRILNSVHDIIYTEKSHPRSYIRFHSAGQFCSATSDACETITCMQIELDDIMLRQSLKILISTSP